MNTLVQAIKNTISISQFNKGLAGQIFKEVKQSGSKLVMKNNEAECVLLSPELYVSIIEELDAMRLELQAIKRLQNASSKSYKKAEEVYENLNIHEDDLDDYDSLDFE
jgi:PHD/YefM family antitoxin component YafN of YafNO toxin-antitoxin module